MHNFHQNFYDLDKDSFNEKRKIAMITKRSRMFSTVRIKILDDKKALKKT